MMTTYIHTSHTYITLLKAIYTCIDTYVHTYCTYLLKLGWVKKGVVRARDLKMLSWAPYSTMAAIIVHTYIHTYIHT